MLTSFDKQKLLTKKRNLCTITHTILTESHLFFVYKQKAGDSIITNLRFLKYL